MVTSEITGRSESQQPTGSQIIGICMEIYLKIDKMVKMYKKQLVKYAYVMKSCVFSYCFLPYKHHFSKFWCVGFSTIKKSS